MSKPNRISSRLATTAGLLFLACIWTSSPLATPLVPPLGLFGLQPAHDLSAAAKKKKKQPASKTARPGRTAKTKPPGRKPFTAAEQQAATIPGIPEARFWADSAVEFVRALPAVSGPWLALSSGGADGAFGAGILSGWSESGQRPEFSLVTGVSAGALMAPFAFLGPKYDPQLRDAYTTINSADIFELGGKGESFFDTWPLRELIAKWITPELLADVAVEHRRGRRLFVLTTNLDAERPVAWNMGEIAAKGDEKATKLFRDVLLAASSIPGAFPPVLIDAAAGGHRFQEMHVDGGLNNQFFVAPEQLLASTSNFRLPVEDIYVVINTRLSPDFDVTERDTISILGRSISVGVQTLTRIMIDRVYAAARRSNIHFHISTIDSAFTVPSRGMFDPDYMKALFQFGFDRGKAGSGFRPEP